MSTAGSPTPLSASQIIARIQKAVAIPWREVTSDIVVAGDPIVPVSGIAVTMMATLDVLRRAVAESCNLVITHEPTFYGPTDNIDAVRDDELQRAKADFIRDNDLVIWRFHDHWHLKQPDGVLTGMVERIGWQRSAHPSDPQLFSVPESTLRELAAELKERLGAVAMRITGNPDMTVTKVALSPGSPGFPTHQQFLQRDEVQVLVTGECREWETIPYVYDALQGGLDKGLIVLGHVVSEQAGMEACVPWLREFLSEVPVQYIATPEPYWLLD